ncbi:golgin subfamily B member 1-like [Polyodon spathula]|uniref:golgin subfamily B member 1-like n=1 Tax=Polyodon spathula TaxID=7913 RepID=UPI001B7F1C16|nr:golgin subfamily B member 1-like [Polyodon spathula]
MLSRLSGLAKGVNSVLQELSGDGEEQHESEEGALAQAPPAPQALEGEDALERLAQTEQLVVHLKELIRERDAKLQQSEARLKEEREAADAKLSKLKLQAKAKVVSLNKQIEELKKTTPGSEQGAAGREASPNVSLTVDRGLEEEVEQLRLRLQEEATGARTLQETVQRLQEELRVSEECQRESEARHSEQVRSLQEVVQEKDVRFQEQVQRHEEELVRVASQPEPEQQQLLKSLRRKAEEMEEALHARSQVVEMLQQELNSADQQNQILTEQFRRVEAELVESQRQIEEKGQRWRSEAAEREAELAALREAAGRLEQERLGAEQREAGERNQAEQERQEAEDREVQSRLEDLSGLWGVLWSLMERLPGREEQEEPSPLPPDPLRTIPALQAVLRALEGRLDLLSTQNQEKEARCTELSHRLEQLQGELQSRAVVEEPQRLGEEESSAQIRELELQLHTLQEVEVVSLRNRLAELEEEKGSLQLHVVDFEELRAENESLRSELDRLKEAEGESIPKSEEGTDFPPEIVTASDTDKGSEVESSLKDVEEDTVSILKQAIGDRDKQLSSVCAKLSAAEARTRQLEKLLEQTGAPGASKSHEAQKTERGTAAVNESSSETLLELSSENGPCITNRN